MLWQLLGFGKENEYMGNNCIIPFLPGQIFNRVKSAGNILFNEWEIFDN
jgi:hypothetical protein